MMVRIASLVTTLLLAVVLSGPPPLFALTINVSVNGTTLACPATSTPCDTWFDLKNATLPGGTPFTIDNGSGGAAKIIVDDVSAQDLLQMQNTVFIASQNNVQGQSIVFWATFASPPTTSGGNVVNYKRRAQGSFIRGTGAPITASVTVNGKVVSTSIMGPTTKTVVCGACGAFTLETSNPLQFFEPTIPLPSSHELRGEITALKLPSTGDKLQLSDFKVWSYAGGGADLSDTGVTTGCTCTPGKGGFNPEDLRSPHNPPLNPQP